MNRRGLIHALWSVPLAASMPNVLAGVETVSAYPTTVSFREMLDQTIKNNMPALIANMQRNNAVLAKLSARGIDF